MKRLLFLKGYFKHFPILQGLLYLPYFLFQAWQFLIEAEAGKPLSMPLLSRLATINLGPQDDTWQKLGFRTLSHPDPLVRVRTAGRAGSERLLRLKNKSQLLQRFMGSQGLQTQVSETAAAEEATATQNGDAVQLDLEPETIDREACDLQIILGMSEVQKICLISQLVDISGEEEEVSPINTSVVLVKRSDNINKL